MLEAGYMSQLMMALAPAAGIGLCPIGALHFERIRGLFLLEPNHIYLHSLIGGRLDLALDRVGPRSEEGSRTSNVAPRTKTGGALVAELRRFLGQQLPDFMVPSSFVLLDALPLTPNGKLARTALPSPEETPPLSGTTGAPRSETERTLATILGGLLQRNTVEIQENLFDLGANSLDMVRFSNKLREVFKREIPVVDLFKYPTIGSLARHLNEEPGALVSSEQIQHQARRQIEATHRQRQLMEQRRDG